MTKCFAYLRVSSIGQTDGDGFPRQLEACQKYAQANDLEIVEVFRESITGTSDLEARPALGELLAALEENGVKTVVIEKLDRLARDLLVQENIIRDMQKFGYTLHSSMEPDLCSNDPSRVLMRQIFGAIAQYDKTMIVIKTRAARERIRREKGKCEGRTAFGTRQGESETLDLMMQMGKDGIGPVIIAEKLNSLGHKTRMGGHWHGGTVANILSRQ